MPTSDPQFDRVRAWFDDDKKIEQIGESIRLAVDWVIDGARTGRYSIGQLQTSEKIYIGNRVEHEILHKLGLEKVPPLDTIVEGIEVDIKFSLEQNWMIPPEAINQVCLIVSMNDDRSVFNLGLIRIQSELLGKGNNRDKKLGFSSAGRQMIDWIRREHPLPENFLLHLDPLIRSEILALKSGQLRVREVFRRVIGQPISTNAVDTLAVQRDPSKRIRDARKELAKEGIGVFSATYDNAKVVLLGYKPLKPDHWISIRLAEGS